MSTLEKEERMSTLGKKDVVYRWMQNITIYRKHALNHTKAVSFYPTVGYKYMFDYFDLQHVDGINILSMLYKDKIVSFYALYEDGYVQR